MVSAGTTTSSLQAEEQKVVEAIRDFGSVIGLEVSSEHGLPVVDGSRRRLDNSLLILASSDLRVAAEARIAHDALEAWCSMERGPATDKTLRDALGKLHAQLTARLVTNRGATDFPGGLVMKPARSAPSRN